MNLHRLVVLAALLGSTSALASQPTQYLGISPMGLAGFLRLNVGSYELFYERHLTARHALRAGLDFIHVHQGADHVQTHQWTFGGSLTYRYYFGEAVSPFAGLRVGYRRGFGHFGLPEGHDHTLLSNRQLSVIPQLGFRFAVTDRLYARFHVGIGYGPYDVEATGGHGDAATNEANVRFSRDVLGVLPLALDTELSLSFAF